MVFQIHLKVKTRNWLYFKITNLFNELKKRDQLEHFSANSLVVL